MSAAADAVEKVGRALRIAAQQDADREWWTEYRRRQAANHVALMLHGRTLIAYPNDPGARARMIAALNEYRAIADSLTDRFNKGMQP